MRWVVAPVFVLVLSATGCAAGTVGTTASTPPIGTVATTSSVAAPTTTLEQAAPCSEDAEAGAFVDEGVIGLLGDDVGDAERVAALRWAAHPGCERVVLDLVTADGAPATRTGLVAAELRRDLGLVRVTLADQVSATAVADNVFGGELAAGAYVVRSLDGPLFVDVHLGEAALGRVLVLSSPARVVIDLQPGGDPIPPPAARGERIVVLAPRTGIYSLPLEITGYGRTFEANVIARIRQGESIEGETFTTAADWVETWGQFEMTLAEGPEEGPARLFVGEESAKDGTEQGVEIDLE